MPDTAQEKTEQPTQQRITKSREEGNVPSSTEMLSAITLATLVGVTAVMGKRFVDWAAIELKQGFSCDYSKISDTETFINFANGKIISAIGMMLPFFLMMIATGLIANVAISGWNFTPKPLAWKLDNINPVAGFKRLFSLTGFVRLISSVAKIIFVAIIVYFYLKKRLDTLVILQWVWSTSLLKDISLLILGLVIRLCIAMFVLGIADLVYHRWRYIEQLKMTKQDIKDERKNYEGPPEVKRRIRQKQFEMAMRRMLQEVPHANVVLVNPTHVAVALKYNPETMPAPMVVAKGKDHMCEKIKDIARAYGVPIIRRPTIARSLFETVELGQLIPDSLFMAVAEVLALIYRLRQRKS